MPGSDRAAYALFRPRYALVDFGAKAKAQVQCARLIRASGRPMTDTAVWVATARGRRVVDANPMSSEAMTIMRRCYMSVYKQSSCSKT